MENTLTRRQKEIIQLISTGNTSRQIADKLGIQLKTVTTHKSRIYMILKKFGVRNNNDLMAYAKNHHHEMSEN